MTGLALTTNPAVTSWTSDFTGLGFVEGYGPGGPGGGGEPGVKGGGGGTGGGYFGLFQYFQEDVEYTFEIGVSGTPGNSNTGGDPLGVRGTPTKWGAGDRGLAPAGYPGLLDSAAIGPSADECLGDIRAGGGNGTSRETFQFNGAPGGKAGGPDGGLGGVNPNQNDGPPGDAPGGGGAGGGQLTNRDGGLGGNGGIKITQVPNDTRPGYKAIGFSDPDNYVYMVASDTTTHEFTEDGEMWIEATGAAGGSRGGQGFNGGCAGGGGAYAARLINIWRSVFYSIRRGTPGTSSVYGSAATTDGQDSFLTLTPMRIKGKQRGGGVGTLTLGHPTTDTLKRHGFEVGQSVVIAGVDANFNGTRTVTAVDQFRSTISFAISGTEAFTPFAATGLVSLAAVYLVKAEGGKRATDHGFSGDKSVPGLAANSIGTIKFDGEWGTQAGAAGANGGTGGAGGGPTDGLGGQGGNAPLNQAGNPGDPGEAPGGAGGGGRGISGGHGGQSAQGGLTGRYIKSIAQVNVDGTHVEQITRMTVKLPNPIGVKELEMYVIRPKLGGGKEKVPLARIRQSPYSLKRQFPTWVPFGQEAYFNAAVGGFNLASGLAGIREKILADDFRMAIFGDSVSEGWTSYNLLTFSGTQDFPRAFPRRTQAQLVADPSFAASLGGTGLIIPNRDTAWVRTGSGWSNGTHYLFSQNAASIITLTPYVAGNRLEVVTSGPGGFTVKINGAAVAGITGTGSDSTLKRTVYAVAGPPGLHTIELRPTGASQRSCLFGAGTTLAAGGITVDNFSQGGTTAFGTGQAAWSDTTAAPAGMLKTWTKFDQIYGVGNHPDLVTIFLGGNDSAAHRTPEEIAAAFETMITEIRASGFTGKILLMPDIWTEDRDKALMQLAFDTNVAMLDVFFLAKRLNSIFGGLYNGDIYGHLNAVRSDGGVPGSDWMGQFLTNALLAA